MTIFYNELNCCKAVLLQRFIIPKINTKTRLIPLIFCIFLELFLAINTLFLVPFLKLGMPKPITVGVNKNQNIK